MSTLCVFDNWKTFDNFVAFAPLPLPLGSHVGLVTQAARGLSGWPGTKSANQRIIMMPPIQCCSCLFVSGRTVIYRSYYKRPQFPPKIDFGGPNYKLQRLLLRLMLTGPARLLTVRPAGRTRSTCVAWQLQLCPYTLNAYVKSQCNVQVST